MEIKWNVLVAEAMREHGGKATLKELYETVAKIDKKKGYGKYRTNKHPEAKIRQTVQLCDNFYQKEKGSGTWYLKKGGD